MDDFLFASIYSRQLHLTDTLNEGPVNSKSVDHKKSAVKKGDVFDDFLMLPNKDMQVLSTSLSSNSSVSSTILNV